jgi:hypothetical protein
MAQPDVSVAPNPARDYLRLLEPAFGEAPEEARHAVLEHLERTN